MASILDEFHARAQAKAESWDYIVGAIGYHVANGDGLTADRLHEILRKAERYGAESLDRKGVERIDKSIDEYIDSMRPAAFV